MNRLKEKAESLLRRAKGQGGIGAATVVLVTAVLVVLNVIVYALASKYSWYLYTAPQYEHQIGNASETLFADLDQGVDLKIHFCMAEEELEGDTAYRLVLETARQFSEKYDFISVDFINITVNPGDVKRFKYGLVPTYDSDGKPVKKNSVTEDSVIFDAGNNDFTVTSLVSFFVLDSDQYVTAYDGERVMSALIHRTMAEERPTACFTRGHGETSSEVMYNMLVCAGYDIETVDLSKEEIPAGTTLLVISNPLYDFEKAAEGSGITTEYERLTAFCEGGGNVLAILDPLVDNLPHFSTFLSEWGLGRIEGTVRDMNNSLTSDGFAVTTDFADSVAADSMRERIRSFSDADVVVKRAAALALDDSLEGKTVSPVLKVGSGASIYVDGEKTDSHGNYTVAAYSESTSGGGVFLISSVYLTSPDAIRSNGYANADFVYSVLEYTDGAKVPLGTTILLMETERLEGLTRGTIRLTLVILVAVIPAAVCGVGVFVRTRRKNR